MTQISFRAEINEYTNRVLGVIKEKYGLQTKAAALDKFAEMYGEEFVEGKIRDELLIEMQKTVQEHNKKYPNRRSNLKELNIIAGIKNVRIRRN